MAGAHRASDAGRPAARIISGRRIVLPAGASASPVGAGSIARRSDSDYVDEMKSRYFSAPARAHGAGNSSCIRRSADKDRRETDADRTADQNGSRPPARSPASRSPSPTITLIEEPQP
jgi:hypothetical protein